MPKRSLECRADIRIAEMLALAAKEWNADDKSQPLHTKDFCETREKFSLGTEQSLKKLKVV